MPMRQASAIKSSVIGVGQRADNVITGRLLSSRIGRGECSMSAVLLDLLLFICVALFLTGIMIVGAILVG